MKKIIISLTVTGILLLVAGTTGLFLTRNNRINNEISYYSIEELTKNVESLIEESVEPLKISMVYVFENNDPYFLITESASERGAIELRANMQTGLIYTDGTIARRWNIKYMQHIRNHRIMSISLVDGYKRNNDNQLTITEAVAIAQSYETQNTEAIIINLTHHEFYGYYAFHLLKDRETVGILRINSFSGLMSITRFPEVVAEVNQ